MEGVFNIQTSSKLPYALHYKGVEMYLLYDKLAPEDPTTKSYGNCGKF